MENNIFLEKKLNKYLIINLFLKNNFIHVYMILINILSKIIMLNGTNYMYK